MSNSSNSTYDEVPSCLDEDPSTGPQPFPGIDCTLRVLMYSAFNVWSTNREWALILGCTFLGALCCIACCIKGICCCLRAHHKVPSKGKTARKKKVVIVERDGVDMVQIQHASSAEEDDSEGGVPLPPPPGAGPPVKRTSMYEEYVDPGSGMRYWADTETGATTWDQPPSDQIAKRADLAASRSF
jgi:hypothetical protein